MEYDFLNKQLKAALKKGSHKRIPEEIMRKCVVRVQQFESAEDIRDIIKLKSLNFEKLKGTKKKEYSVRLSLQWRLEMKIEWIDIKELQGKILFTAISNHYKRIL